LYSVTSPPPIAASKIPAKNCQRIAPTPPAGGCCAIATTAFTTGAPAKMIDITTAGVPFAPNASNTQNAPIAPTMPASSESEAPFVGKFQSEPEITSIPSGANTAVKKYAIPTNRKAL